MRIVVGLLCWILSIPFKLVLLALSLIVAPILFMDDGPPTIAEYVQKGTFNKYSVFGSFCCEVYGPIIKWPF
jgi:hypothetical protein